MFENKVWRTFGPKIEDVLSVQFFLRVAFLVATRSVWPVQERRPDILLTVKKTSVEYTVIIVSLSLLSVNDFIKPACASVSHC
jgi:hypothetical protein